MKTKICYKPTCNEPQPLSEFGKDKRRKDGYRADCRKCRKLYCQQNKKRKSEYDKVYRSNNIEKKIAYRKEHKAHISTYIREYNSTHKLDKAANSAKRRGSKVKAHIDGFDQEYGNVFASRPDNCHVDHIIPITNPNVCGLDVYWNFQYLTKSENLCKSNKFDGTYENESWRLKYNE